jgi:hypothetical protein
MLGGWGRAFSQAVGRSALTAPIALGEATERSLATPPHPSSVRGKRAPKPTRMEVTFFVPLRLLWPRLREGDSDAATLHACYALGMWRQRNLAARALLLAEILLWWPISSVALIVACTVANGRETRRRFGKPVWRQIAEQIDVVVRHSIPPPWYYLFGFWDDGRRRKAHLYINRYETKRALWCLLKGYLGYSGDVLGNKLAFHEACARHGLPTTSLIMALRGGAVVGDERPLPEADLFVKPWTARGGAGAERWDYLGNGRYRSHGGETCASAELVARLAERSRKVPQLVQLRLTNHPDLLDLSAGALATARVVTVLNESGEFEAALAVFRTAVNARSPVDNFHAGGIVAGIDLVTGELGQAHGGGSQGMPRVRDMACCDSHPLTGAKMTGRRLPFWPEVKDLARRAHALVPNLAVVGWDIAITFTGPVIVEGNSSPDVDLMQVGHQAPMGETRVAAALAFHARRALDTLTESGRLENTSCA